MITMSNDTKGGRLRTARISTGESIRAFAPKVDVTSNYLSLVERNERAPSDILVQRIASVTGKDFNWLMTGQETAASKTDEASPQKPPVKSSPTMASINPQLFLQLVLMRGRGITKESLAAMLMVPLDTLDDILLGKDMDFRPNWAASFPLLARHLDLPSVCHELENLNEFLRDEEQNARNEILLKSVQTYLKESFQRDYRLCGPINKTTMEYGTTVPCVSMPLEDRNRPGDSACVHYFPDTSENPGLFSKIAKQEIRDVSDGVYPVVVFNDAAAFEHFVDGVEEYCADQEAKADADPYNSSEFVLDMSVLLVDSSTMQINKEKNDWN